MAKAPKRAKAPKKRKAVKAKAPIVSRAAGNTWTASPPGGVLTVASYDFHFAEFLSRGMSRTEADRLAREVVARDDQSTPKE